MNTYPIFISSSDSYSDIWPLFFDLFKKYWPEFKGEIILNTETLSYSHPDLNIRSTKVGQLGSFGKVLRAGLDVVPSENILLIMIDYIFMGKVNHEKLEDYYHYFNENNLDSLCLQYQGYPNTAETNHPDLVNVLPPAPHIMFSYQIAFWKKKMLREMALPHENPWMSEWYGAQRAEIMKIKLACPKNEIQCAIAYHSWGCLHQGKWLDKAVVFLNSIDYPINFDQRGLYVDGYSSIAFRLRFKFKLWYSGLRGSYWDLFLRKASVQNIN